MPLTSRIVSNFAAIFCGLLYLTSLGVEPSAGSDIEQKLLDMTFADQTHGWRSERNGRAFLQDAMLVVEAAGGSPILSRMVDEDKIGGQIRVVLELRTTSKSELSLLWTTRGSPRRGDLNRQTQPLRDDGRWHRYEATLAVPDRLTSLSLRFEASGGVWEIRSIAVFRKRPHPLSVLRVAPYRHRDDHGIERDMLRYTVFSDAPVALDFRAEHLDRTVSLASRQTVDLAVPIKTEGHLASANLVLLPDGLPRIAFPVFRYRDDGNTDWISRPLGQDDSADVLDVDPSGRMARIRRDGETVAIIAPIVHRGGVLPDWTLRPDPIDAAATATLRFAAPDAKLEIEPGDRSIRFRIEEIRPDASDAESGKTVSTSPLEGPIVRVLGTLRSGLLPGVEFLGPGDVSSSTVDIEEPYHERSRPNPRWVTLPLAVLGTEKAAVLLRWNDMTLQPTFSSPNRFDGTDDHRVSLIGSKIEATLELAAAESRSDEPAAFRALRHHVAGNAFPQPPEAPRTPEAQRKLCLKALQGPLRAESGDAWGYALEADWPRKPYADVLSSLARLTGQTPKTTTIVPGGADIANDAIYFLTGRAEEWKASRQEAVRAILALRNPDGSFLYRTRFPEVESGVTSFGYTAIRALELMEFVRQTGDRPLFETLCPSLEYLKVCNVPRGGFYRDSPLHTPDLQTAASLVWLYAWAFEFSGETSYLELARRHAFGGLAFLYQWSDRDTMLYAVVPEFGGTERRLPLWFATSRPRVGLVYAYALNILSRFDPTVDWKRVARGILHATEKMQYPDDDPRAGCVPEIFEIESQKRLSWSVNPGALISLRRALEGELDSLDVVIDGTDRYVSPYPLRKTSAGLEAVDVPPRQSFQILRNGMRLGTVEGAGPVSIE